MKDAEKHEQALVGTKQDLARQARLAGCFIVEGELRNSAQFMVNMSHVIRKVLACADGLLGLRRPWSICTMVSAQPRSEPTFQFLLRICEQLYRGRGRLGLVVHWEEARLAVLIDYQQHTKRGVQEAQLGNVLE